MLKFLIYLVESGLCLSVFYFGYVFLFRKETYFNFNRFYLLAGLVLSVLLPLVTVQFNTSNSDISTFVTEVSSYKNYYEELILITDPDYQVSDANVQKVAINGGVKASNSMWNYTSILFYIYLAGLLFFTFRLFYLLFHIYQYIRRNSAQKTEGIQLVMLQQNVPSFSFLRWVFVNKNMLKQEEFEQILAHEKVHVHHKHSVDLLLAQVITLFQWFNPLTWRVQKSIKTCHEYIADRQVLAQGHELFDYQSLLLSQLISIRSVELVNNFNLLSIKKRIAMMNKIKSGRMAKMKALLAIPILSLAFMFFANCTETTVSESSVNKSLKSITESYTTSVKGINVPKAVEVRTYDDNYVLCTLSLSEDAFYYNGAEYDSSQLSQLISSIQISQDKARKMTILLEVDEDVPMRKVDDIRKTLRKHNLLKIGFVTQANELREKTALFMLLPPQDAIMLDESKFDNLFYIEGGINNEEISEDLNSYIESHKKYIMLYKYNNQTLYADYLGKVDMVHQTIKNLRRTSAKADAKDYDALSSQDQKPYRKQYPITLVSNNVDVD